MPTSSLSDSANTAEVVQTEALAHAKTIAMGSPDLQLITRTVNDEVLAEALKLAARNIPVVACYGIVANEAGTRCACPKDAECRSKGKHPVPAGGFKAATCDVNEITQWFTGPRPRNVAIRTGLESGLVVLDCDKRSGGSSSLMEYEVKHGELPKTPTATTGDGFHHYFEHPGTEPIKSGALRKGLDIKADGGMTIAAPSHHKSGRQYRWLPGLSIHECELAPIPAALLAMIAEGATKISKISSAAGHRSAISPGDAVEEGGRHSFLVSQAGRLRRQRLDRDELELRLLELNNMSCVPPLEEDEVRQIAKDMAAKPPGPLTKRNAPALLRASEGAAPWHSSLITSDKGALESNIANVTTILGNDDRWTGVLAFDEFAHAMVKQMAAPWHEHDRPFGEPASEPEAWKDEDTTRTSAWLAREYGVHVSAEVVYRALKVVSERHPKHPIRDYLEQLTWDGVPRVGTWLATYLGVDDNPYARQVGRYWLISAIARVMKPGCKVDHVLILEGPQGHKKSTALRVLAGDQYFIDTPFDIGNKDAFMQIRMAWIVELAELSTLSRAEAARAKQFFTSGVDVYRPPYGHQVVKVPRHQVFAGTVNEQEYLKDDTGNRRYWPVPVGEVDVDGLSRDRDQIWAEALDLWRRGEVWYPITETEHALCHAEQEKRLITDPWVPIIEAWLASNHARPVTTVDVLGNALNISNSAVNRTQNVRVGIILRQLGGKRRQARLPGGQRGWVYDMPSVIDDLLKDALGATSN